MALGVILLHPLQGVDTMLVTRGFTGELVLLLLLFSFPLTYTWFCMSVIGCLFSIRLLWTIIRCAYCMAIKLICLNVFRICG